MTDIPEMPRPRLDTRDLQLVLALAASGSTARAASRLHLTQPAVSRALLAVEDKLSTKLFERSQRGLTPTEAGERLLAGARECLLGLLDLERRTVRPQPPTRLRMVCECYTAYHWLPSALTALQRSVPGLEVSIEMAHTAAPVAALAAGQVDVALLTTSELPRAAADLQEQRLFSDEIVFVVARSHALARQVVLTRNELREQPLLVSSNMPAGEASWFVRTVFGRRPPRLQCQPLPLTEAILDVARAGLGVAVLSEWIAQPHLEKGDLVVLRLDTGPLQRPWRFAHRRGASDAAERLLALLQSSQPRLALARTRPA